MSEADLILEDLGRSAKGFGRAFLGQGLGMGWGDEAEAWLKSKIGQGTYEDNLNQVRKEYGQYSEENPAISGLSELSGAAAPGVVMGALSATPAAPAAAPAAGATGARMLGALGRLAASPAHRAAAVGAGTGAISAAGAAPEGERMGSALSGAVMGAGLGYALPPVIGGLGAGARWARERFANTPEYVSGVAARYLNKALGESGQGPQDLQAMMQRYQSLGVPGMVANATPALTDLGEAVAQRTGPGTRKIEEAISQQKAGSRERVNQQVRRGLNPGDYYGDQEKLVEELRNKADTMYDAAYSHGAVDDPTINYVLSDPVFAAAYQRGQAIAQTKAMAAKLKGEDPSKYVLPDIYVASGQFDPVTNAPIMELAKDARPTVMALDYVKRGLDDMIDSAFSGSSSAGKGKASALKELRNEFVAAIDRNVPEYRNARKMYAGDMEVRDALRSGYEEFGKLDHEQVLKMLGGMSQGEKEAFRTGVARHLYGQIMDPSNNFNAAKKIINSPETQQKLEPLFETPAHYRLFKAAMDREMQLFDQANKMLGGAQTAKRLEMRKAMDASSEAGTVLADAVSGGVKNSLMNLGMRLARSASMSEQMADKLASMLVSKDPHEVAAVVQLLEQQAKRDALTPARVGAVTQGAITSTGSFLPPQQPDQP